ncbi:MAG: DUF3800 domain-containing protein [Bacillota bacterium]|nr:DUF3800 domain-containing protein [Bacillota bacterium]
MFIYIDESGSMASEINNINERYFVISLLLVNDPETLRKVYIRYVKKNMFTLKNTDRENKMFLGDKFLELKGHSFTPEMKKDFIDFFCRNGHFKLFPIIIDGAKVGHNFYKDKARAFNFALSQALAALHDMKVLTDRTWYLNIDERNVKSVLKYELEEFLMTGLSTSRDIADDISVTYFDSKNNKLIQIADVFSNIFYSNIITGGHYSEEIRHMQAGGYIVGFFHLPL